MKLTLLKKIPIKKLKTTETTLEGAELKEEEPKGTEDKISNSKETSCKCF